jgi:hypothetical protein
VGPAHDAKVPQGGACFQQLAHSFLPNPIPTHDVRLYFGIFPIGF